VADTVGAPETANPAEFSAPVAATVGATAGIGSAEAASRGAAAVVPLNQPHRGVLSELRMRVGHLLAGSDEVVIAEAVLVANELATNALVHGHPPGEARLHTTPDDRLRLEVDDASPAPPRLAYRRSGEGGLGLGIIERVAACWGVMARPGGGKTVVAELDLTPPHSP
jgi:anti-sigma regulatory factor (Ser/Thr protein kinase)